MKNKVSLKRLLLLLAALILAACAIIPTSYYVEAPGATIDLKELITVNGKEDEASGSFSLTSVEIRQATVFRMIKAKLTDFEDLVSEKELLGGATDDEYNRIQAFYMESSQNTAIEQALKLADKDYTMSYKGVYVLGVEKNSDFYGKIGIGDTVTAADGQSFKSSEEFMKYVQNQKIGQKMQVTYLQDGKEKTAEGKLMKLPTTGKPGIGITLTDHTEVSSQEKINFDLDNIGGPSAGLMFTLEIYEQLTDKNLRQGKEIAGTGTISTTGEVGRIGGIDKKVASASKSGAEIFFAPDDDVSDEPKLKSNYEEAKAAAKKLKTKMKIVPVKNVQDALDYLESLAD
ncbi:SepM family pheromone-processing serine protease [Enterococcus songbeiensis]|uniref:SepM family pheromone-processing serine protease n=1 Tax=Enterococcus songbeiensis TaxID=2559927 RepID=UPI0010F9B4F6|nr:SepM family pheromone-processing serine protease [Enterococcus songbeiensis]